MAWRNAKATMKLRDQLNAKFPNRSKKSDGTIGDEKHQSRSSDHNPWVVDGKQRVVTALDITNDPDHGLSSRAVAEALIASKDSRIKYIISDGQIASGSGQDKPAWKWRKYSGANGHFHHFHISVKSDKASYDSEQPWNLNGMPAVDEAKVSAPPKDPGRPLLVIGNKGLAVRELQRLLNKHGAKLDVDDWFGDKTLKAVKAFQKAKSLAADGKAGDATWDALLAA